MNNSPETVAPSWSSREIKHQPGGSTVLIPYIITPRNTLLLNGMPTLRWNKVPDATSYLVRIMKGSQVYWQEQVSGTEIVYPGIPPLEPGVDYLLTVETNNGKSSLDGGEAKLGFKLLNEEVTQAVEAAAKIANSDLADETKALNLAQRYSYFNLRLNAIEMLEVLVEQDSQTVAIYYLLGSVYAESGLNLLAEELYSKAIALASHTQDLEVLTKAQAGLAGVKIMLGKEDEEEQLANQAQAGYKELEDSESASQLRQRLVALKRRAVDSLVVTPRIKDACCFENPNCSPTCNDSSDMPSENSV